VLGRLFCTFHPLCSNFSCSSRIKINTHVLLKSTFSGIITHHCCHCCMMYPIHVIYLLQAPCLDCLGPSPNYLHDLRQQSLQGFVVTVRVAKIVQDVLKSLRHVECLEANYLNPLSYPLTAWKHAP
jgi:hypothetical protein